MKISPEIATPSDQSRSAEGYGLEPGRSSVFETIDLNSSESPRSTPNSFYVEHMGEDDSKSRLSVPLSVSETKQLVHDGRSNPKEKAKEGWSRRIVDPYGCLIVFLVLGPFILIISGCITKAVCLKLKHEHNTKILSTCRVTSIAQINYTAYCKCGDCDGKEKWTCWSTYPCYMANVEYTSIAKDNDHVYAGMGIIKGLNVSNPCSVDLVEPCYMRDFMNAKLVEEEVSWLQSRANNVQCVLDLDNKQKLPLKKHYKLTSYASVVQCFFWPSSLIILVILWASCVVYDTVKSHIKRKAYQQWRAQQPEGFISPPNGPSLFDIHGYKNEENMTRWRRCKEFARAQIMQKDTMLSKKRLEFLETMRTRKHTDIIGTKSRPKLDTYKKSSSFVMKTIEKYTLNKDAEGMGQKKELKNLRMFLRLERIPISDSEEGDGDDLARTESEIARAIEMETLKKDSELPNGNMYDS